jgi:crotonobetainyl-CoA:carnitine CoA-transferase CaiB-like acyl-CoA transferase
VSGAVREERAAAPPDRGPGTPLDGVRVVELVDESAEYCGRMLAGLGADVVKVEPPDGAPSRRQGPFLDDEPGPDRSLAFWADNVGKRSVVVPDGRDGDGAVRALVGAADVLVHTLRPAEAARRRLDYERLASALPRLVVCAVTPFGHSGPWADYQADDLVLMALGGSMAACGYGPGPGGVYDTPPLAAHGEQAWRTASTYAAIAVLAALWWRDVGEGGRGQFIDVSAHECSASMTEWHCMTYLCSGSVFRRGAHPTLTAADGRQVAALNPDFLGPHVFANMLAMLEGEGVAGPLSDPAFADAGYRAGHYGEVWRAMKRLAAANDGERLYRLGQSAGLPWGVIRAPEEVADDAHLQARGHFVELDHPELGRSVTYPGAPFLAHGSPWRMEQRPPLLGEHTDQVAGEWGVRW